MKRMRALLCALVLMLLAGCGEATVTLSGEVLEYHENGALVIRTKEGEAVGLIPGEDFHDFSWVDSLDTAKFEAERPENVVIRAECGKKTTSMRCRSGTEVTAYTMDYLSITEYLVDPFAAAFPDGVGVERWEAIGHDCYRLSDGTELLRVDMPTGPENSYVVNHASFDDLYTTAAKAAVRAFYKEQGLLYDVEAELERAYDAYQEWEGEEDFPTYRLSQSVSPYSSNEQIFTFVTSVLLPICPQFGQEISLYHTFDRTTGQPISNYELFTVSPEELLTTLLAQSNYEEWDNSPNLSELQAALKPEYIALSDDHISIFFPQGTLPSQEHAYGFGFDYTSEILSILKPWARPTA